MVTVNTRLLNRSVWKNFSHANYKGFFGKCLFQGGLKVIKKEIESNGSKQQFQKP